MFEIKGKYATAQVYAGIVEREAISQIFAICNNPAFYKSKIAVMPDCHPGKDSVIGLTATINGSAVPNLVGSDIGCGVTLIKINKKAVDFKKLDQVVRKAANIGDFNSSSSKDDVSKLLKQLKCLPAVDVAAVEQSFGTLGGGNHFIELGEIPSDSLWLSVHSGSRLLGKQCANYYQNVAIENRSEAHAKVPLEQSYLTGTNFYDYLHDLELVQRFAELNRKEMLTFILEKMDWAVEKLHICVHNYIDTKKMVLRKGAISALFGEIVVIPLNMKDGMILAVGKSNEDFNYSAPHGAGRLFSRSQAKEMIALTDYRKEMQGVYSSSISQKTIDEAPMAYKPLSDIAPYIDKTVETLCILPTVYNYKNKA